MPSSAAGRLFVCLLAGTAARAAAGGGHVVGVKVSDGNAVYSQKIQLQEGEAGNYAGPVGRRQMIFNAILTRDNPNRAMSLQYQLEVSNGQGIAGRAIQVQSELSMRSGEELETARCGPWTVTLALNALKGAARPAAGPWSPGGLPNYRLTSEMRAGGSRQSCRLVSKAGVRSQITDSMFQTGKKYGFILNGLFQHVPGGRDFSLQYQTEMHFNPLSDPVQTSSQATLTLNKRTSADGENYKLSFLLEGEAPKPKEAFDPRTGKPVKKKKGPVKKEPEKFDFGTVQPIE